MAYLNNTKITTYTADGSWNKDPRAKVVEFYVMSGGGGGGSGKSGVSGSAAGGGGGGPGQLFYLKALAALLVSSPYAITIGQGGAGGSLVNGVAVNGNNGIIGGTSSVGSLIIALGGGFGLGAFGGTSNGGRGSFMNEHAITSTLPTGIAGGQGTTTTGNAGDNVIYGWATGGGGGAGYTISTPRTGNNGGSIIAGDASVLVVGGLAGANTGATAGDGNPPTGIQLMLGGTGGGGGGQDGATTAGTGGNGAIPGGGGGGGAGNLSSNNSGAGGNGARGQILIIEYF